LTRVVVEAAGDRAPVIAATGSWWTGQAVDFARYATSLGASAIQVVMPPNGTDDSYYEHFRTVAASTPCAIGIHGQPSMGLFRKLAPIENIVAFNEEFTPEYTLQIYEEFGDRWNIFAGGSKSRLLTYLPYGMHAYYSTFSTFAPKVAMKFWHAVERKDLAAAAQVVLRYDVPFFRRWTMPFWTATLEHFGIARRYMRPPAVSLTDAQMKDLASFYKGLELS
jgi:dihydrodipicolinate synthase/N-acetylneuraminate lyase